MRPGPRPAGRQRTPDAEPPPRPRDRSHRVAAARGQHPVLGAGAAGVLGHQAGPAVRRGAPRAEPGPAVDRRDLDRRQQRLDEPDPAHPLGRRGRRRARLPQLVSGELQPPVLGRHPGAAAPLQPAHPAAQVLPQAAADLGAGDRARVVGAGVPVHAAAQRGVPAAPPGDARQGPGDHAQGLRALRADPDQRDEFPRGDALHPGQARPPAAPPTGTCSSPRRAALRWHSTPWGTSSGRSWT